MSTASVICLALAGLWILSLIIVAILVIRAKPLNEEQERIERLLELGWVERRNGVEFIRYPDDPR